MMPIPTHLKNCIVPNELEIDELPLVGTVRCPCSGEAFEIRFPGQTLQWNDEVVPCTAEFNGRYFFLIRARCIKCGKSHLLLDVDFHGWNGLICHDIEQAARPRPPLAPWKCVRCGKSKHKARIEVVSEGKDSCLAEADGAIDDDRWPDAFESLTIDIRCTECDHSHVAWVSCETM